MTRLWKSTVATLLGLATLASASAIEPVRGTAVPVAPAVRHAGAGGHQNNFNGAGLRQLEQPRRAAPNAANALLNQQAVPNQNAGVLQAQGVNRIPGQGAVAPQPNNLGTNQQGQPFVNPNNQLDQFGAPIQRVNQQFQNQFGQDTTGLAPQRNLDQALATSTFGGGAVVGGGAIASTEAEAYLTGQARSMQGAGEYNRNTAEALKTLELARAIALENARNGLKTYFELKDINANYQAKKLGMPLTKEKLDEWNRQDQPERLTRSDYNADTGTIRWPALLQTDVFADERIALEEMFARRTANEFGPKSDFYRHVSGSTQVLKERLKAYLRNNEKFFNDEEYVVAQNFLSSLAHEARTAPALDGLVAN
jgi:hypothetical protein